MQPSTPFQKQFNTYLKQELNRFDSYVLSEQVHYFLSIGGKRLRPVLMLMAADLFDADSQKSLPAAIALELFHNFTLVHDDMMDDASLRRGEQTTHVKFGFNSALLTGDLLLVYAYTYLQKADILHKENAWQLFNTTAAQVCEGQQYDLAFENSRKVAVKDYMKMIELKTAVLLGTCLKMGVLISGGDEEDQANMYEFGRCLGISFQLQDDILDTFGKEDSFGKKVGGDILQDKKTFLLLRAFEKADNDQTEKLTKWIGTKQAPNDKISVVKDIFAKLNVKEEAQELRNEYYERARTHLDAVKKPQERKEHLRNFTHNLLFRET